MVFSSSSHPQGKVILSCFFDTCFMFYLVDHVLKIMVYFPLPVFVFFRLTWVLVVDQYLYI